MRSRPLVSASTQRSRPLVSASTQLNGDRAAARQALQVDPRAIVLLCFGRMTPYAKADLGPLICCYRDLRCAVGDAVELIVAGDDSRHHMAEGLRAYARALGCEPGFRVLPDVTSETKQQLFAASDVFVAPSDHIQETFGIALAEAQAAGLPVVASDWSGFREVVEDGVTGFLVPTSWVGVGGALELTATPVTFETRNTILSGMTIVDNEQLFSRLLQLVQNEDLRKRMGAAARQSALRRFDWPVVTNQYCALFEELLSVPTAPPLPFPRGPFTYDVQGIFAHYPRCMMPADAEVAVSRRGEDWLTRRFPLSTRADLPFEDGDIERVLRIVADSATPNRIDAIVDAISPAHHHLRATWLLSRLLKYGLLRVARADSASPV